ncbi:MAG TPA: SpoIIE family protein phosphatase [Terriglobia bacterium]|nr:SpoIIE family protein phosphatase [Terriglobia bacterium]
MPAPRILIADDQVHVVEALQLLLKNEGFVFESVNSPRAVVEAVQERDFDVLLLDLNYARDTTSGAEGIELLSRIHELNSSLPVVLMTAWASIELAIEAMQNGGRDFVQKPWDNDKLLGSLRRHAEEGRILREKKLELKEAREIQQRLLPTELPELPGCDIQAFWQPANEVGGDYFDVIRLNDTAAAFCIADVSGKGLPAALLMSNTQASVRAFARSMRRPAQVCRHLNRVVSENARAARFTTLFYGVLDFIDRTLRYTNAGHVPPMLVRRNGDVVRLADGGTVLGIFPDAAYEEREITLEQGDRLVLLTDGITEAENAGSEEFGEDRLTHLLVENRGLPADELKRVLLNAVDSFAARGFQDDATLVIVDYSGVERIGAASFVP